MALSPPKFSVYTVQKMHCGYVSICPPFGKIKPFPTYILRGKIIVERAFKPLVFRHRSCVP